MFPHHFLHTHQQLHSDFIETQVTGMQGNWAEHEIFFTSS